MNTVWDFITLPCRLCWTIGVVQLAIRFSTETVTFLSLSRHCVDRTSYRPRVYFRPPYACALWTKARVQRGLPFRSIFLSLPSIAWLSPTRRDVTLHTEVWQVASQVHKRFRRLRFERVKCTGVVRTWDSLTWFSPLILSEVIVHAGGPNSVRRTWILLDRCELLFRLKTTWARQIQFHCQSWGETVWSFCNL